VSFDIFDTLFFRKCGAPQTIFETMGEHKKIKAIFDTPSTFVQYRLNAEKVARRLHKDKEEITLQEIYDQLPISQKNKLLFKKIELSVEANMLVVNPKLEKWIDLAYNLGKQVILISDMYLSPKEIENIALSKLKSRDKISKIYMSSSYNKTKSTGNLFLNVIKDFKISHKELLHVGDNPQSDIAIPKSFGIQTLYYGLNLNEKEALHYETLYLKENLKDGNHVRHLSMLENPYENGLERFYFRLGCSIFAPLLWEFSHWIFDITHKFEIAQFNFIMREGAIFEKCFNLLYPQVPTQLIYASRKSTNFLTLDSDDIGSINFSIFRSFSIHDLYASFFLEIEDETIKKYKNTLCENTHSIVLGETTLFQKVLNDIESKKDVIKQHITTQKKLLCEYLGHLRINQNSTFIDFGGTGTIFTRFKDILSNELFPATIIVLYRHERGYLKLVDKHILSFLPYSKKSAKALESIARTPEFIEILLNGDKQTTLQYHVENSCVVPSTYLPKCNHKNLQCITNSFWQGIEQFFKIAHLYNLPKKTFEREHLATMLARIIELPTKEEVAFLGDLEHDEGRGTTNFYKIINEEQLQQTKNKGLELIYQEFLANPMKTKHQITWVQGAITTLSNNYLLQFHGTNSNPNQKIIDNLLDQLDKSKKKKIMVYGAGDLFIQLLPSLVQRDIIIEAVIDTRAEIKPFQVERHEVISLEEACKNQKIITIVICSGVFNESIKHKIQTFAIDYKKTFLILDGNVP
jgi:predicted HAD superfamily hydrolase